MERVTITLKFHTDDAKIFFALFEKGELTKQEIITAIKKSKIGGGIYLTDICVEDLIELANGKRLPKHIRLTKR